MIRRKEPQLKKSWFEIFIDDYTFPEKLVVIMWVGLIGIVYIMLDMLSIWFRVLISLGVFILSSLLTYWFGQFMSSDQRDWN